MFGIALKTSAKSKKTVSLTGIILSRVDGDGRGGAALSMKFSTNIPIKFIGMGDFLLALKRLTFLIIRNS